MSVENEIVAELARQNAEIDNLMREEQGLPQVLAAGFHGGLSLLMKVAYLLAVVFAVAIFYCGYRFFIATTDQQFWGILLLLAVQLQVGTKLWIWLESQRAGTLRELKKIQLALARLQTPPQA